MDSLDRIRSAYEGFVDGPVGQHFIKWLEQERQALHEKAEKSLDPQEAYGLTKTAHAYTVVLTHLDLMSGKPRGDRGNVANQS